jgi:hypothetical protein
MEKDLFDNGYALIIGVGGDLPHTVADAEALAAVLRDEEHAGYPGGQIKLLTEKEATKGNILAAIDDLHGQVEQKSRGKATVMVYFSGHGGTLEDQYFLVPNDFDPDDLPGSSIDAADFSQRIDAIPAQKTIVLLDCCHAGGIKGIKAAGRTAAFRNTPGTLAHQLDSGSGKVIIASSKDDQKSYTGRQYSIFTECLLEALNGKNTGNDEPYVSFAEVWSFLDKQVPARAPKPQQPVIHAENLTGFPLCKNLVEIVPAIPKVFIVHDPADHQYLEELRKQLAVLARRGKIEHWDPTEMMAGSRISQTVDRELSDSQLVVLLVSADYLYSDECYELQEKAEDLGKPILPVIVRDCLFEDDELINDLPKEPLLDGELIPVARWPDKNQAMRIVAHHIKRKAKEINENV